MNPTPTISEAARRAAEQEIDEFLYRSRITQPRRPFEAGHYVQQALDSAHPAPKEGERVTRAQLAEATEVCRRFARENDEGLSIVAAYGVVLDRLDEAEREVEALKKSANFHRDQGITLLDAKWLDPRCHKGCQSLVIGARLQQAEELLREARDTVQVSLAETDISDERKAYRKHLFARLATFLNSKTP